MTRYGVFAVTLLLTAGTSLAVAQPIGAHGSTSSFAPLPLPLSQPAPVAPVAPMPAQPPRQSNVPVGACDANGCWGTDGARYNRGGGNFMIGSNGKTCQFVAPGAPLTCN